MHARWLYASLEGQTFVNQLMEPVTHLLTGACLGRSGFNRKTAYATLAMTLAAEAPDLDIAWGFRGPLVGFEHHRGFTHTFLAAPLIALVVTLFCWGFHRLRRKQPPIPPRWLLLWCFALLADLSHLLLDYTNNYGIRPFAPFQPHWYSWDIVFIFEPVMFVMLLGGLVIPALLGLVDREISSRKTVFRGRGWAIAALVGVAALYTLRGTEHARAIHLLQQTSFDRPVVRVAAEPYPIDPFHWQGIVETDDAYHFADVNTRSDAVDIDEAAGTIYKPPVTPFVVAAKRSGLGRVYLDWSQFPLVEDIGPGDPPDMPQDANQHLEQVNFHDMRFGYTNWFGIHQNRKPLSGSVFVAPDGQIEATYMDGQPQN
ncbi:MAG TPA: metal-dependent hydrolase [Acidobacteriaceae bacterium]|nr:metal-dependent hydrolase [Acidobacteriaceae bacterium]